MVKKNRKIKRTLSRRQKNKQASGPHGASSQHNTLQQALALHRAGRLPEAETLYRHILQMEPNHPDALHFLGVLAQQVGKHEIAVELIGKAIKCRADYPEAHYNLGIALYALGKIDAAAASYRQALALKRDYAEAHYNLGIALKEQGKLDEAINSFRQALKLKPDYAEARHNLGVTFSELGKLDEAVNCYKKTLSLKPDYVRSYKGLAQIVKYTEVDTIIRAMENLYNKKEKLPVADRIDLGFALGKVYEDLGEYDRSFAFIHEANRLKRGSYSYSGQMDHDLFARIKKTFSPDFFASHKGSGNQDGTPVFILGMPRSGTSLVEQILASHPLVFGAGELDLLRNTAHNICAGRAGTPFPECMLDLNRDAFAEMGSAYVEKIRKYAPDVKYITDKMPNNFLRVGLIKTILPKAKVIHCMRNPMDTCFSIFKTDFTGPHGYAYDMVELGRYYNLYQDLMAHWEKVLPGFSYSIRYEELVADQRNQTKGLLDFCGLAWDEACLNFHKTARKVRTVSLAQVRQPIYKDSVELWKRYEKQLEPLRNAIYG